MTKGFFHKMVEKLRTVPVEEMRITNETDFKGVITDSPSNLNTYYSRPMSFWAYNGTVAYGDCSKKVLRIILKQRNRNSGEDLAFYQLYMKNFTGSETNARTVINTNNVEVLSCGKECDNDLADVLWFLVIYTFVLFFNLN